MTSKKTVATKKDFSVIVATNERFVSPVTEYLKKQEYNLREQNLNSGDVWIAVNREQEDGKIEECVGGIVEIKSIPDIKGCLAKEHAHIRGQINSMHRSEHKIPFKKFLIIGDMAQLDDSEWNRFISLFLATELEHPEKVTWSNIPSLDFLPKFIDTIANMLVLYDKTPRKWPSVEKLNISLKRLHPENPRDFLQLHLMEVRGVGETKAELIASKFESLGDIQEVAREEGEMFLTKQRGRDFLGVAMSKKVYASFGLELGRGMKRKQSIDAEFPSHASGNDLITLAPKRKAQTQVKKRSPAKAKVIAEAVSSTSTVNTQETEKTNTFTNDSDTDDEVLVIPASKRSKMLTEFE